MTPTPPPNMQLLTDANKRLPKGAKLWTGKEWIDSGRIGMLPSMAGYFYAVPLSAEETTVSQGHVEIEMQAAHDAAAAGLGASEWEAFMPAPAEETTVSANAGNGQRAEVGTRIIFLETLEEGPTDEHPGRIYARKGDSGVITKVGDCKEGYWVTWDGWKTAAFGAKLGKDFRIDPAPAAPSTEPGKSVFVSCGGCGATHPSQRCIGCAHDFEHPAPSPTQGESQELKPCPFCGEKPIHLTDIDTARCEPCGIARDVTEWNTRITPPSAPTQETLIGKLAEKYRDECQKRGDRIATLERELKEAREERDAYQKGCESAKRGENHWHGQWELNQTEKINLRADLDRVTKERDEARKELLGPNDTHPPGFVPADWPTRPELLAQLAAANSALERAQEGIEKMLAEPAETMSNGKAICEMIRIGKRTLAALTTKEKPSV